MQRGVQQVLRGCAENKKEERKTGARVWALNWVWAGSTHEPWVGSGEVFKGCKTLFSSFFLFFLSLLFFESKTLSSLSSLSSSSPIGEWGAAVVGDGSDTVADRPRRRRRRRSCRNNSFSYFF